LRRLVIEQTLEAGKQRIRIRNGFGVGHRSEQAAKQQRH
jgi:hypothetical protein